MPDYSDLAYSLAGVRRTNPYDRRRAFAQQLQQAGADYSPVDHPLQGAARLAQALVGGWMGSRADREEADALKKRETSLAAAMAEPDPKKRIAMLGASDPELGARLSGQLAVEQAKQAQQQEGLGAAATNFGSSFGVTPPSGPTQLAVPPGQAPAGGNAGFANNVGNIRATNINWQDKGQPHNGFETFSTPQAGANAMAQNLQAYVRRNPNMTVADAIKTWAPPNENNTQAYIRGLAESTGINPGMPLAQVLQDQALSATLMDGIARIEKGGLPQGFSADTFMAAAGPGAPPQMAQGSADPSGNPLPPPGMPPAPAPGAVNGPTMVAPVPPQIPDVPRPQPTPQQIQQYQQRLRTGEFGTGQEASSRARAALDAELDRQWGVDRDRARMQFDQSQKQYESDAKKAGEGPQKAFENEGKMRDDYGREPAVKAYRTVVPMLEAAKDAATRPTRAADLNLVYAFAKMMDPESVVRESETGAVQATATVADRLGAYIGQLNGQPMLSPDTRQKLLAELQSRFGSLKASHDEITNAYRTTAQSYGLNPDRILFNVRRDKSGDEPASAPSGVDLKKKYGLE